MIDFFSLFAYINQLLYCFGDENYGGALLTFAFFLLSSQKEKFLNGDSDFSFNINKNR